MSRSSHHRAVGVRMLLVVLGLGLAAAIGNAEPPKRDKAISAASQPAGGLVQNFDHDNLGAAPPGWKITFTGDGGKATWSVVKDPTAPSKPNVLQLTKAESPARVFNLAIAETTSLKNIDLSVRIKPNTGNEDQGGGLIWRCKDEDNYYICRFNPLESNFRVYKVEKGKRTQFESAKTDAKAGEWHTIRARMVGEQIECWLDGKKLLEAKDGTFTAAGKVGLWTKADAASSFDDFEARAAAAGPSRPAS